jgi:hypothetical protein
MLPPQPKGMQTGSTTNQALRVHLGRFLDSVAGVVPFVTFLEWAGDFGFSCPVVSGLPAFANHIDFWIAPTAESKFVIARKSVSRLWLANVFLGEDSASVLKSSNTSAATRSFLITAAISSTVHSYARSTGFLVIVLSLLREV